MTIPRFAKPALMRAAVALSLAGLTLAACGVDGPPQRPVEQPLQQQIGISIGGDARVGVSARL